MPAERTVVTELGTALGVLGQDSVGEALAARSPALDVEEERWAQLDALWAGGAHRAGFEAAFANGRVLLEAGDGLRGRRPARVEWTGGRRPPGDEVAPIDLRIDHVYLVSCKYWSACIANASPARLFEGLLTTTGNWDRGDWYQAVAPAEHQALYAACRSTVGLGGPDGIAPAVADAGVEDRARLRNALRGPRYPAEARDEHGALCRAVSRASAERWQASLAAGGPGAAEAMLWRLLRVGSAPYFVLGQHGDRPVRHRVASPWDWRQAFTFTELEVSPSAAGQPRVDWVGRYRRRHDGATGEVAGHVEVRWSHGRFAQPPEAKVYLDTDPAGLPGYFSLEADAASQDPPPSCATGDPPTDHQPGLPFA